MKLRNTSLPQCVIVIGALLASPVEKAGARAASDQSSDPGCPRERYQDGNRLIVYQPQVDDWKNFQQLTYRMAVSLTPKGDKEVVGVVEMKENTRDMSNVAIAELQRILRLHLRVSVTASTALAQTSY